VKEMASKIHTKTKVTSGVFIPGKFLSQADITGEDIEIEIANKEIRIYPAESGARIYPAESGARKKVFTFDSPLWKCVGFVEVEGISGREHDRYIYDEER
jgi:hypothetical protein